MREVPGGTIRTFHQVWFYAGVDAAAAAAAIDGRAGSVAAAKKAPKKEEPEGLTTTWVSDCSIRASLSCGPLHCLF